MKELSINFTESDISAILCALPLVQQAYTTKPGQAEINFANCTSAASKLREHSPDLTQNEMRVIAGAVDIAVYIASGQDTIHEYDVDKEWLKEIHENFFTLNRLNSYFHKFFDPLLDKLE